jgi:acyl carrier protein
MNENTLRARILEILHRVAPEAGLDEIGPNENLREALDIDSFDFLKIVVGIHEAFGVDVPESDYRRIATLKGMTEYLAQAKDSAPENRDFS